MTQSTFYTNEFVAQLLQQVTSLASDYAKTDKKIVEKFVSIYYRNLNDEDAHKYNKEDLAGIALNHYSLIKSYNRNSPNVEVFNPTTETQHFYSSHSVIQMVAYDRPFLVDTLLMTLEAEGINVHRTFHTIVNVEWDDSGSILDVHKSGDSDSRNVSLIHCEISRNDQATLDHVKSQIINKINVLDNVVADWDAMKSKLLTIKTEIANIEVKNSPFSNEEVASFLDWILDDHFIFLGYREYKLVREENSSIPELYTVGGSGLGLLDGVNQDLRSESFYQLPNDLKELLTVPQVLLLSKSSQVSPVHRPVYMDFLGVQKFDDNNNLVGEYRFIGLLTSRAYQLEVTQIPLLREKTARILAKANLPKNGHAYHRMLHIINSLPRDDLFQGRVDELYNIVSGVANLQDKKRLRLFTRVDHYQRFVSCLVYIPRAKFNTDIRMKIQQVLTRELGGTSSGFTTEFDESHHARVHIHVRTEPGKIKTIDVKELENKLSDLMKSWDDGFEASLLKQVGEADADSLLNKYSLSIPASYKEQFDVRTAVLDIKRLDSLRDDSPLLWHLYQSSGGQCNQLNLKVYGKGQPAILSNVLPILEKFGVEVISAQTYEFNGVNNSDNLAVNRHRFNESNPVMIRSNDTDRANVQPEGQTDAKADTDKSTHNALNPSASDNSTSSNSASTKGSNSATLNSSEQQLWMQEYELMLKHVDAIDMSVVRQQFEHSLEKIWLNKVESDHFNELILTTKLDTYDVVVLRALSRYMQQARAPFSRNYIQKTLVKHSSIAVLLVQLFKARMNPEITNADFEELVSNNGVVSSNEVVATIKQSIKEALTKVSSLDEDRILQWYLDLINAMLRTNFYQRDSEGKRKDRLSFKFAADKIPNLPKPKPMFEIFIYSPRVEAIHLRGGKVARGGLRWSDRMEDFRTEVLGLVKAQMVKNAVIVPVGSKGGFIVKQKTPADGREAFQKEGIECYKTFLRGMLDLTDNLVDGEVVPPDNTVRHDEDDPYLVVAADKGTASFSDIANGVAAEYGFWLDDAFASGGSVGYDHKAMGITARGAWESVKRHFRMLGRDIQHKDDFSVVGIGDMSGDVFGNGMLLSKFIKLQAAFNHLHIFIDPNPDLESSYAERERLFNLPRSTWDDYDKSLISAGGGVFSRQDKSIDISPEMKSAFDIEEDSLTPNELINRLLKAPVDLIWNGGIGTYIKSSDESHADVGDRANDDVRVNGQDIRAKVFGEGGNLGCTQQGRIEYALCGGPDHEGGHLYTDAIDNSGGVNCSDHEVNIKILLGKVVEQGDMTIKQRNELLKSMTDEVGELVLRQNYLQPQAIELSHLNGADNLTDHKRFINHLESEGRVDRVIEFLPSDDVIEQRMRTGLGMTRPELSVILAYGKMWVYEHLLASDLPDDAYFVNELRKYFPDELASRFFEQMTRHRLHREIISTYLTNSVVNRLGIEAVFRLYEETNQGIATIIRAYAIARDIFQVTQSWKTLESLANKVDAITLLQLEQRIREVLEQGIVWLINAYGSQLEVASTVERFQSGVVELTKPEGIIADQFETKLKDDIAELNTLGLEQTTAQAFAILPYAIDALDTVLLSEKYDRPIEEIAKLYFEVYQTLHIDWLLSQIEQLPQQDHWDRRARYALLNELTRSLRQMMTSLLTTDNPDEALQNWQNAHQQSIEIMSEESDKLEGSTVGLSVLSVMISEINKLISV